MLRSSLVLFAISTVFLFGSAALAQNFRMETDVYVGSQKKPICQTLTLFADTMVYDFIYGPDEKNKDDQKITEVTVFDMNAGRVVLLDMAKNRKTVLTHEQLVEMTTAMKVLTTERDEVFHFAANPKFELKPAIDQAQPGFTLTSPKMTYVVECEAAQLKDAPQRYQEFSDWSARLNACRPGNLPPFARMEVSKELAQRNAIPKQITRTTIAPSRLGNKKLEMRSVHHVNWTLSTNDRKRIETVAQQIGTFQSMTFVSYTEEENGK